MRTLEDTERSQILKIISKTKWRIEGKDGAPAILGIHPSTLRVRLHKFGMVRPETKEGGYPPVRLLTSHQSIPQDAEVPPYIEAKRIISFISVAPSY
jgi:hypothetical protein